MKIHGQPLSPRTIWNLSFDPRENSLKSTIVNWSIVENMNRFTIIEFAPQSELCNSLYLLRIFLIPITSLSHFPLAI
jgi:hypothetical protein